MSLPQTNFSDRRGHDRHPLKTSATLGLPDGRTIAARTLDIGKGGAGVVCDLNLPVGTVLALLIRLPARPAGSALFEASATTASCTLAGSAGGFRLGLQFNTLSAAALDALKGVLP
jgi:hypothetical protein